MKKLEKSTDRGIRIITCDEKRIIQSFKKGMVICKGNWLFFSETSIRYGSILLLDHKNWQNRNLNPYFTKSIVSLQLFFNKIKYSTLEKMNRSIRRIAKTMKKFYKNRISFGKRSLKPTARISIERRKRSKENVPFSYTLLILSLHNCNAASSS